MSRPRAILLTIVLLLAVLPALAQVRTEVPFPDLPGYVTLRCDFHMHTVFSDGEVWPTVRVREAWRDGLDAIAITDHVEHQAGKGDVKKEDGNRPFEIAKPEADKRNIILIRGCEITRFEPHGHFNAIGITDTRPINAPKNRDAIKEAIGQGAFVFWNHPPAKDLSDPDASGPQREYLKLGWMQGIEVFNGGRYYPHAHQWCLEHTLTMIANSDVHGLIDERFPPEAGIHRAMTLVFATERTEAGIFEALRARRAVCFASGMLVGEESLVRSLFDASVSVGKPTATLAAKQPYLVPVHNASAVTFQLEANGGAEDVSSPASIELPAGTTVMMRLSAKGSAKPSTEKDVAIPYVVKNALIAPEKGLPVTLNIHAVFPG